MKVATGGSSRARFREVRDASLEAAGGSEAGAAGGAGAGDVSGSSSRQGRGRCAVLAFGERAKEDSQLFISLPEVQGAFSAAGCESEVLARVVVRKEEGGEAMPVAVLKLWLAPGGGASSLGGHTGEAQCS